MNSKLSTLVSVVVLGILSGCGTENICLTRKLWSEDSFHVPADPTHIEIRRAKDNSDVAVVYDELGERNGRTSRKAYWVLANARQIQKSQKPRFIPLESTRDLPDAVTLQQFVIHPQSGSDTNALLAVLEHDGRDFSLYRGSQLLGHHGLPLYRDGVAIAQKVILTPLTISGDAVIYGSIVGAVGGYIYLDGLVHSP